MPLRRQVDTTARSKQPSGLRKWFKGRGSHKEDADVVKQEAFPQQLRPNNSTPTNPRSPNSFTQHPYGSPKPSSIGQRGIPEPGLPQYSYAGHGTQPSLPYRPQNSGRPQWAVGNPDH